MSQIETDRTTPFYIADWEVRPSSCEICRNNELVKLEPKVMDLLLLMASRPGEVISRIQLEEAIWSDMVVGYDALTKSVAKLREALGDTSKPAKIVQTIPKKGYRLNVPVRHERVEKLQSTLSSLPNKGSERATFLKHSGRGLLIVVILVALFMFYLYQANEKTEPGNAISTGVVSKPSLVVLPFRHLDVESPQDYFSRGITDDLITALSSYSSIEVVSSRTAFQYQGQQVELPTLVEDLGVQYVVEGTVRRSEKQIRINVQMVDAGRGTNIWAQQYNRPLDGLFDIQDELRASIISALSVKLSEVERQREQKRYTNNYEAYDTFLRGQSNLIKRASADDNLQARQHFEKAVAIDPGFARAYAALAMANADAYRHDWVSDPDTFARISLQQAEHALTLDPDSRHASMAMGYVQFFIASDHDKAADMAERTLALDPGNADANMLLAAIYVHSGQPEKAEAYVESGIRLSPGQSALYVGIGALANLLQGNLEVAHQRYAHSLKINPERLLGKIYMTITLVRMERLEEAAWYAEEIRASVPNFDAEQWANKQPYKNKKVNQQLINDLYKAGLK